MLLQSNIRIMVCYENNKVDSELREGALQLLALRWILGTSIYWFLYLHGRLRSPILSSAIINNAGVILNHHEL